MKAVIFGVGRMGSAIAYAMKKLGYKIVGVDPDRLGHSNLSNVIDAEDFIFYRSDSLETDKGEILLYEKPDIVISSMPYHQNLLLARYCIVHEMRYCDLGGSVPVSKEINDFAKEKAKKPVMTDLGLAPGWVNIVTEWGCKEVHGTPEKISMMVGGLPVSKENPPLNYAVTWSVDGLINEYRDKCEILRDGEVVKVNSMDGYEKVYVDWIGQKLEAFYTSGGASHTIRDMHARGVKECTYKTLRYMGHRDVVKFLIKDCGLPDDCLIRIFEKGCGDFDIKDMVIMKTKVKRGSLKWEKEIFVPCDENFNAMQRATAFPISAVASLMAEGELEGNRDQRRDYYTQYPSALTYKDIPIEKFNEKIGLLGLKT